MVEDPVPDERDVLARLLRSNVDVVVRSLGGSPTAPLSALVAARTAAEVLDDVTRALVADARRAGHTWAEVGRLLRTTRQAAQQRYGDAPALSLATTSAAARRAVQVVEQLRDGDLEAVAADWDEVMREQVTLEHLGAVWARVLRNAGPLRAVGRPTVVRSGPYEVVDVPLAFEHGPMRTRVTFNRDGSVAGLLVLTPDDDR